MCIEEDTFLAIDSNELFQPIVLREDVEPLDGCVLSIRYDKQINYKIKYPSKKLNCINLDITRTLNESLLDIIYT